MATVVLDDEPVIAAWLEQRRALGQDGRDEVWEGDHHVAPHGHARNGNIAMQLVVLLHAATRAHARPQVKLGSRMTPVGGSRSGGR